MTSAPARKEAKLCYMGHASMENHNGLVVPRCGTAPLQS
jgi:hypothetical protein